VCSLLQRQHKRVIILQNPLLARFSWRLTTEHSRSRFSIAASPCDERVTDCELDAVFVRGPGWIDQQGWDPDDLAYAQTENMAAMLGWLWDLPCYVLNRQSPLVWYRSQAPLLAWGPLLLRAGLRTPRTLLTNRPEEARAFRDQSAAKTLIYAPLTSSARYPLTSADDWNGMDAMMRHSPVCLTEPHGAVHLACVVGQTVLWEEGLPSCGLARLEPALLRFARAAGLDLVELALAETSSGLCVVAVDPSPRMEHFQKSTFDAVCTEIAGLLVGTDLLAGVSIEEPALISHGGSK
jgi:hypothetical protein